MRLTISSTTLASRLSALSKVLNSKNSLPILDCFLFEAKGNVLTITASDSENVMTTQAELDECDSDGTFAVNNHIILNAVKELPEQPLTLDVNMDTFAIKVIYMNGVYNFTAQSGSDFPRLQPLHDGAATILIESKTLSNDISHSIFATANEELRPVMNGVYFDITTEDITMVASDGHKLVRLKNLAVQSGQKSSFILPKKPATMLRGVLGKEEGPVNIMFDENNAYIKCSNFEMVCRLIEGRYPNYNSVIPTVNPYKVVIDRLSFLNALKRVSVFSNPASSLIKLNLSADEMMVSAQDIDFSTSAEERITCDYSGDNLCIGFKATYLIEILSNIGSSDVILELADPSRAGLIIPSENDENEDLLMLLMPMMLND